MDGERYPAWLKPGVYLRGDREYRAGAEPLQLEREEIDHFRRCGLLLRCDAPETVASHPDPKPSQFSAVSGRRPHNRRGRPRRFPV